MCQRQKDKEIWDSARSSGRRQSEERKPGYVFISEFPHKSSAVSELGHYNKNHALRGWKKYIWCPLEKEIRSYKS